jgi:hypothetical protein
MEWLLDILTDVGGIGAVLLGLLLALLAILLPLSAYSAQKWAYRNWQETRRTNDKLDELLLLLRNDPDRDMDLPRISAKRD